MRTDIGEMYKQIELAARNDEGLLSQWMNILDIVDQTSCSQFIDLDIHTDAEKIAEQVESIITEYPIPKALSFLYFGLFDGDSSHSKLAGFYIAGGTSENPEKALANGNLDYFPEKRFIRSGVLDAIKKAGLEKTEQKEVLSYALLFGAATILAKEASKMLRLKSPIYVGFDSGDYSLIH